MFRLATMMLLILLCGCNSTTPTVETVGARRDSYTATVASYDQNAEWDHFDDGSFATFDHLTLEIDDNKSISVAVSPNTLPEDSPFRISGTCFRFTLSEPLKTDSQLAWGSIIDPTVVD